MLLDLDAGPDHYVLARRDPSEAVVIAFNRSDRSVSASFASIALDARVGITLVPLLGGGETTHVPGGKVMLELHPLSATAYQVK